MSPGSFIDPTQKYAAKTGSDPSRNGDDWVGDVEFRIPPGELKRLSAVSNWRGLSAVGVEWSLIAAGILAVVYWNNLFLYPFLVLWIGARQHALVVLMHDGAHRRLHKSKALNDFVSEVLLAWPMFATTRAYKISHFAHHRFINTDDDPDWVRKKTAEWEFPKSWCELGRMLFADVLGLKTHQLFAEIADVSKVPESAKVRVPLYSIARVLYYGLICFFLVRYDLLTCFLLYWIIPLLTWFKVIYRIRGIAEHFGLSDNAHAQSRTTIPSRFEALFVAPRNVNYHLEHHLYPSVPFYRLPVLHRLLMASPDYRSHAHVTQTYWGVLRECCGQARAKGAKFA